MKQILQLLKKLLGPKLTTFVRPIGHGIKTYLASLRFGFPAKNLILIGVNGTKGKTTTTTLIAKLLGARGVKTGYISTALIYNGDREYLNPFKMGTLDGYETQKLLYQMKINGCTHVVLEMTSQGLEQNRHWGLGKFAATVFLNAYKEHIEAHGGWENYLSCKAKLFANTKLAGYFITTDEPSQVEPAEFMWQAIPDNVQASLNVSKLQENRDYKIIDPQKGEENYGLEFEGQRYKTNFVSSMEIIDLVFAIQTAKQFIKLNQVELQNDILDLAGVPGRMEWVVNKGQLNKNLVFGGDYVLQKWPTDFKLQKWQQNLGVLVDYAHEPESMRLMLETLQKWIKYDSFDYIIHLISCDGVGRDDWKKAVLGDISYKLADFSIVTTDNYGKEDNPEDILELIAQNYPKETEGQKYLKIADRRQAFIQALQLAKTEIEKGKRVVIVSTGVGTEQGLTQPTGVMNWDERGVWASLIQAKN